jgi:hypothetical protein
MAYFNRRASIMHILAITPDQFDPDTHSLPTAGELLMPGMRVHIQDNGVALEIKPTTPQSESFGTVIELCQKDELVEIAVTSDQQEDGGFYFEQFWVVTD